MFKKFILAATLVSLLSSSIAAPLRSDSELLERTYLAGPDTNDLAARDVISDLIRRAKTKSATPSPKTPPKKAAPPAGAKGQAMQTHVQAQRTAKNAAKNAQRGSAPSAAKQQLTQDKKDNRAMAKKQNWQAGVAAGKYKMGLSGKPIDKNTPMTKAEKTTRTNKKAAGLAAHQGRSATDNAARASKQAADRATAAAGKPARTAAKVQAKAAARQQQKATGRAEAATAKTQYKASIDTKTFPDRKAKFTTPQGEKYTGRDARQALYKGHLAANKGGIGFEAKNGKPSKPNMKHPKTFDNRPNTSNGQVPLPNMKGSGREFGMLSGKKQGYDGRTPNPSAARLITTPTGSNGAHKFEGVVAHPAGSNDHVEVKASP